MNSCQRAWYQRASIVDKIVVRILSKWGGFVARRPCLTISGSLFMAIVLTGFTVLLEPSNDAVEAYAPTNSMTYGNYEEYQETWDQYESKAEISQLLVSLKDEPTGNVLTEKNFIALLELYDAINEIVVEHDGVDYSYQDICHQYENGKCRVVSILDLFHYDLQNITSSFNNTDIPYPVLFSPYSEETIYLPLILGQEIETEEADSGYTVTSASAFKIVFAIDTDANGEDVCYKWYEQFLVVAEEYGDNDEIFEVIYDGYYSFDDELSRTVEADNSLIVLGFLALTIFSTMMVMRCKRSSETGRLSCDGSRWRIGWLGLVTAFLALGSSWGIVGGILGIKFMTIVTVTPYLLIGIGR